MIVLEKYQDIVLPLNNEEEHLNDDEYAYLNDYIKSKQGVYQSYLKENNLTACSPITEGVVIDDQYINAALENEQRNRDVFRSDLEVINKQAAECESYD